jgi:CTP synthase
MAKHIFVTGGVVSSLGKGLTSGATGLLLESRGLRVAMQKFDPYLNVDPGTMSPYQHGEVYVTDDGAETDLDLGHYERFTRARTTRDSNFTSGQIYNSVISKERRGEYLGRTIQVVPHITNEIKSAVRRIARPDVDVVITEVGGTVGDIEGLPFLEAIRQFGQEVGRQNAVFVHLTLIPYLRVSQEVKTKPTQHSVGKLRELGIVPDVLICRTEKPLSDDVRDKIALFCSVERRAVIEEIDLAETSTIYELPLVLQREGLDALLAEKLQLKTNGPGLDEWKAMLQVLQNPAHEVTVAVVGKYIHLNSAYESIYEALTHGGIANHTRVIKRKIEAEELLAGDPQKLLAGVDGILVPGGFGMRGIDGKVRAIQHAREKKIPFFGICLGMQCAAIEFARDVCGLQNANSSEFDADTPHPVVCMMDEQRRVVNMGGTMRLGAQTSLVAPKSLARAAYGSEQISERHRHRYEFNNAYRAQFEKAGMRFSGTSADGKLVEIMELEGHPWFLSVQFHPELKSRPIEAHPLFRAFIAAALARKQSQHKTTG